MPRKIGVPELGLHLAPEQPQQQHVEADVQQPGVEEAVGDQAPPVAGGDRGAEQRAVAEQRAAARR